MRRASLTVFLAALSGCATASPPPAAAPDEPPTQPAEPALEAELATMVQPLVERARVHGAVAAASHGDETSVRAFGALASTEARFEIGSVTKVYTALLLADAIERGEIAEGATIADVYEGELPAAVGSIALTALASHTSGLPRLPPMEGMDPHDPYADFDAPRLWQALKTAEVGSASFAYSNFGAAVLGQVLSARLGQPYEALVRERILEPLEMNDTDFSKDGLTPGHEYYGGAGGPWTLAAFAPAGGLVSTAADQLRFLRAQLSPPDSTLGRALERSHAVLAPDGAGRQVAYGWMVTPTGERWHNGQTGSFHSFLAFDPESEVAVVVLADTAAMEVDDAGKRLLQSLAGQAVEPPSWPTPRPVSPELMARYEGAYRLAEGFVLTVSRDGGQLFIQATGQDRFPIYPVGEEHRFELRVTPASGTFEVPATGPATALVWSQNGANTRAPRVSP